MFKTRYIFNLTAIAALAAAGLAHAGKPPGSVDVDTVVPAGPLNPNSGAPAEWPGEAVSDDQLRHFFLLDRLEYRDPDGTNGYL